MGFPSGKQETSNSWYEIGKDVVRIQNQLDAILHNQGVIMGKFEDLNVKIDELQATVDADQAADAAVVRDLQAEIDRLRSELANGATADQLAALADRLEVIREDVAGPNETEPNS